MPSLIFLFVFRTVKQRWQERLRRIRTIADRQRYTYRSSFEDLDNPPSFIGDLSCRFNAHSPYIRCAVNPSGPCENCPHYEQKK